MCRMIGRPASKIDAHDSKSRKLNCAMTDDPKMASTRPPMAAIPDSGTDSIYRESISANTALGLTWWYWTSSRLSTSWSLGERLAELVASMIYRGTYEVEKKCVHPVSIPTTLCRMHKEGPYQYSTSTRHAECRASGALLCQLFLFQCMCGCIHVCVCAEAYGGM
jgi:hypothetical protein